MSKNLKTWRQANRIKVGTDVLNNAGEPRTVAAVKRGMASEVCLTYTDGSEEWMHWSEPVDLAPSSLTPGEGE